MNSSNGLRKAYQVPKRLKTVINKERNKRGFQFFFIHPSYHQPREMLRINHLTVARLMDVKALLKKWGVGLKNYHFLNGAII